MNIKLLVIAVCLSLLTSPATAADSLALKHSDPFKRAEALKELTDQAAIAEIANHDPDSFVRSRAIEALEDQAHLVQIATQHQDSHARSMAVRKLKDQKMIAKIAIEDEQPHVRIAAIRSLTDQEVLSRLAIEDKAWVVRGVAIQQLTDRGLLARLAKEDQQLGHEARRTLQQSMITMIAKGDERNVPELISLLNMFGEQWIAEVYLNCNHPRLAEAAQSWAKTKGYTVMSWPNKNPTSTRWGSQR